MTVLVVCLLALTALTPLLAWPLRRVVADPVLPVGAAATVLLGLAALLTATADRAPAGWRLGAATVAGVLAATTAGSPVVRAVFRVVRQEFVPWRPPAPVPSGGSAEAAEPSDAQTDVRPETVLRGGAWIGYLERAAVTATLLAGWPEGIALVLGVKGVGRYSELRESNAPEAFIIGTFASLLWAAAVAGTVQIFR